MTLIFGNFPTHKNMFRELQLLVVMAVPQQEQVHSGVCCARLEVGGQSRSQRVKKANLIVAKVIMALMLK